MQPNTEKSLMAKIIFLDHKYVILESQQSHFILTNPYEGITEEDADGAISILNS